MNNTPQKIKDILHDDPFMKVCIHRYLVDADPCGGRITWEHALKYAGKQIQELWAIVPLCEYHHNLGDYSIKGGMDKRYNEFVSMLQAGDEAKKKYPRKDWQKEFSLLFDSYFHRFKYETYIIAKENYGY